MFFSRLFWNWQKFWRKLMKKPLQEFAQSSEEYCLSPAAKKKMTKNDKELRMEKIKVKKIIFLSKNNENFRSACDADQWTKKKALKKREDASTFRKKPAKFGSIKKATLLTKVTHHFSSLISTFFSSFWSELDPSRRLQRSRRSNRQRSSWRLFLHDFRVWSNWHWQNIHDGRRKKFWRRVFVGKWPAFGNYSENDESHFWWTQFWRLFGICCSCQVTNFKRATFYLRVKSTQFRVFDEKLRFALSSFVSKILDFVSLNRS